MTMQLANLNRETFQINENNCTIGTVIKKITCIKKNHHLQIFQLTGNSDLQSAHKSKAGGKCIISLHFYRMSVETT